MIRMVCCYIFFFFSLFEFGASVLSLILGICISYRQSDTRFFCELVMESLSLWLFFQGLILDIEQNLPIFTIRIENLMNCLKV